MTAPFRFTLQAHGPADRQGWRELARRTEDLGFWALTVPDHIDDLLAPLPALVAAAEVTSTLQLGAMVLCNDYRHPVMVAKEAATVDLLSEGRFILGLGAGWKTTDYEAAGFTLDRPGMRIDRLTEAIHVIRGLHNDDPFSFTGDHYQVTELEGLPKPHARTDGSRLPLLIGGGGPRVLTLAATHADIIGLNINLASGSIDASAGRTATADSTDEKVALIRAVAGARFDDLTLHTRIHLAMVTDDRDGVADAVGPALGLTPDQAKSSPHALVGTIDELEEQCLERRDRWGITGIGLSADALDDFAPLIARLAGT